MKKGQGLTMDVIIIAAISLVVLVVLIAIFTGRLGKFTEEIKDCAANGGSCQDETFCRDNDMAILPGKTTCDEGKRCCISTTSSKEKEIEVA